MRFVAMKRPIVLFAVMVSAPMAFASTMVSTSVHVCATGYEDFSLQWWMDVDFSSISRLTTVDPDDKYKTFSHAATYRTYPSSSSCTGSANWWVTCPDSVTGTVNSPLSAGDYLSCDTDRTRIPCNDSAGHWGFARGSVGGTSASNTDSDCASASCN